MKIQVNESEIIGECFANLMDRGETEEIIITLIRAVSACAMSMESEDKTEEDFIDAIALTAKETIADLKRFEANSQ